MQKNRILLNHKGETNVKFAKTKKYNTTWNAGLCQTTQMIPYSMLYGCIIIIFYVPLTSTTVKKNITKEGRIEKKNNNRNNKKSINV